MDAKLSPRSIPGLVQELPLLQRGCWKLLNLLNPESYSNCWTLKTTQPLLESSTPIFHNDTFSGSWFRSSEWLYNLFPLCVRQYDVTITTVTTNTISVVTISVVTIAALTISGTCWNTSFTTCVLLVLPTVNEVWKAKQGRIKTWLKESRLPWNSYPSTSKMGQNQKNNIICKFQMRMQRICKSTFANAHRIGASYFLLLLLLYITTCPLVQFYSTGRSSYPF